MSYRHTVDLEWALELAGFLFSSLPSESWRKWGWGRGGTQGQLKNSGDSDLPDVTDTFAVPGTV